MWPSASVTCTCHPVLTRLRALETVSAGLINSARMLSASFEAWMTRAAIAVCRWAKAAAENETATAQARIVSVTSQKVAATLRDVG